MSNPHMLKLAAVTLLPVAFTAAGLSSGQAADGKPLSIIEVAERLENAGYGPFTELSMDDGLWEVEARKQNESLEVKVDPLTGNIVSEYRDDPEVTPPTGSMPLPELLRTVQANSVYKHFDEVSFERRYWEIELHHKGLQRELHVDPMTGRIISDRLDD